MVYSMVVNVFLDNNNNSKIKLPEPDLVFPLIPDEKLARLQSKSSLSVSSGSDFYLSLKNISDEIIAALTYMKNNP